MLGTLFIVSAASGAGKTTLVSALVDELSDIAVSVSHTTRAKRPGEVQGRDYHYIDTNTFTAMQKRGEFLESAQVFNHYYGTSSAAVLQNLRAGIDVIVEIDWQGARQLEQLEFEAVKIFIMPPSLEILRHRLQNRATDSQEVIEDRLAKANKENSHYDEYHYLLVNDDFDQTLTSFTSIILAERSRLAKQKLKYSALLAALVQAG